MRIRTPVLCSIGTCVRFATREPGGADADRPTHRCGRGDRHAPRRSQAGAAHRRAPRARAAAAASRSVAGGDRSAGRRRPQAARDRRAVHAPGGRLRRGQRRPQPRRRHAHRVGQDALLQPARPRRRREGSRGARALPVPHQGARRRSAGRAARPRRCGRDRPQDAHVRRRHAGEHPVGRPRRGPGRHHQPGHAPRGDPSAPHEVVQAVREPAVRRHRRAAHVPRPVRQPRRQRRPPPAAHLPPLRRRSRLHLRQRHHRQPARARRACAGGARRAHRRQRRPIRSQAHPHRQPTGRQRAARHPRLVAPHRAAPGGAADRRRRADDRLRPVAHRGRGAHQLPARDVRAATGASAHDPRLSRRLPAERAARHRGRAARRPRARGRRHERARARDRHRQPRRRDQHRLPRHHREHVAADGAIRSPDGDEPRRARLLIGSDRPVPGRPPGIPVRCLARARAGQPGQPVRAPQPPACLDLRASGPRRRAVRHRGDADAARRPPGGRMDPACRRRPLLLEPRELPGQRLQPPDGSARERRDRGHHRRPPPGARRGRPVRRAAARPREGDLHPPGRPAPRRPPRLGGAQGVRQPDGRRLLHRCGPRHHAQGARGLRGGRSRRRPACGSAARSWSPGR